MNPREDGCLAAFDGFRNRIPNEQAGPPFLLLPGDRRVPGGAAQAME